MITPYSNIISVTTLEAPFEFTVKTDNAGVSTSTQFRMPLTTSTGLNIQVDWGDGSPIENITNHTLAVHTYAAAGTYTIKVLGTLLGWRFAFGGDRQKMLNVVTWGTLNISSSSAFDGCSNLTCSATDAPTITSINMENTFRNCVNFNGNVGNWDVSNCTFLKSVFEGCTIFNNGGSDSIKNWNIANNTSLNRMFSGCFAFNQNIGLWDTSSVTDMTNALLNADAFDQNLSNWDINQVNTFSGFMLAATGLSTTNYDLLLVGWEANLQSAYPSGVGYPYTININFGSSKYSIGSAAETARASLVSNFAWTISDGGGI